MTAGMEQSQRQAADAVARVFAGSALPAALASAGVEHAGPARALVQELAYGTLRHYGTLEALLNRLATKPIQHREVALIVIVALYQIIHTRVPAFAVVDQAVHAVAQAGRPAAKPLVNALLRRYLRERAELDAAVAHDLVARWSYPRWWIARLRAEYPTQWEALLAAGNERPPLTLRVNRRAVTRDALTATFTAAGIATQPVGDAGMIVATPVQVPTLPGYAEGHFSVQDAGAQLAASLLDARDGMRVLDACAAPGGKTTHILERADVTLTALDRDAVRLARVRDNIERLRLGSPAVTITAGDARDASGWWDGKPYDRILADVPCTASGVVRRHPDGKWLRRASDVAAFAIEQRAILDGLWPLLAPGGRLLYVTCSLFGEENEARVAEFMASQPEALRETLNLPADVAHLGGQLLPSGEGAPHNQDGFFYALVQKA